MGPVERMVRRRVGEHSPLRVLEGRRPISTKLPWSLCMRGNQVLRELARSRDRREHEQRLELSACG